MIEGIKPTEDVLALWNLSNGKNKARNDVLYDLHWALGRTVESIYGFGSKDLLSLLATSTFKITKLTVFATIRPNLLSTPDIFQNWYARRTGRPPFYIWQYYGARLYTSVDYNLYGQIGQGNSQIPTIYKNIGSFANKKTSVALVINGDKGLMKLYVNGKMEAEYLNAPAPVYYSGTLYQMSIGNDKNVDNIAFFTRDLTPKEIALLHNQFN
jgi:hypothetical protein